MKLYLKIQDGSRRRPYWKTGPTHSTESFCQRYYYDTCFLGNWEANEGISGIIIASWIRLKG